MCSRSGLLLALVVIPLSVAVGFAIGILFPRLPSTGTGPQPGVPPPAAGVNIEEMKQVEELFALAGQKAVVLKYMGGDVNFWIEVESDGNKQTYGSGPGALDPTKPPGPEEEVEGYFLWTRIPEGDSGRESWVVGSRRDLVTVKKVVAQVANRRAQTTASQSRENRQSSSAAITMQGPVWKDRSVLQRHQQIAAAQTVTSPATAGPASLIAGLLTLFRVQDARTLGGTSQVMIGSVPSPLPVDQEVCLRTIREEKKQGQVTLDRHVMKVMCKVVTERDRVAAKEPPKK
jgi:hypothetical protein